MGWSLWWYLSRVSLRGAGFPLGRRVCSRSVSLGALSGHVRRDAPSKQRVVNAHRGARVFGELLSFFPALLSARLRAFCMPHDWRCDRVFAFVCFYSLFLLPCRFFFSIPGLAFMCCEEPATWSMSKDVGVLSLLVFSFFRCAGPVRNPFRKGELRRGPERSRS